MKERPVRILLVHPGASWSTADVYDGLLYGLRDLGAVVEPYRLDTRIEASTHSLKALWRTKRRETPDLPEPNQADYLYHAGVGALEMALRTQSDVVLVVSAMFLHPDVVVLMKRAGLRVTVLFTESPYDQEHELQIAALVDGCWTTERTSVPAFRRLNPAAGYLPHGWHPLKHYQTSHDLGDVPAHDVVFVGTGFAERVTFFNKLDLPADLDVALYGTWKNLGLRPAARRWIRGPNVTNVHASALYRRATIGLNLYRSSKGWGPRAERVTTAESLSPRAYELAACGAFHLSEARAEVGERFGALVPTFQTPQEASALIQQWLADPDGRARIARELPATVADCSWTDRARTVLGDVRTVLTRAA